MPIKRRAFSVFTLSFLDVMCCAFGAVVLLFMILQHEAIVKQEVAHVDLSTEVDALQAQIAGVQRDIATARDNAQSIDQRIAALLNESADARALLALSVVLQESARAWLAAAGASGGLFP